MLTLPPLLHAAQTTVGATPPILIWLACLVGATAAGALLAVLSQGVLSRPRVRRTLAIRICGAFTALAVIPAVVPYDHLIPSAHADEIVAHEAHCHESPAACADAPVTSGPGQLIDAAPLLVEPLMLAIMLVAATTLLVGITRRPILRPPMGAASLAI
jgi:hypothetical protein